MSIYSDKLAHVQVVINCQYFVAQMCTCEDMLAHNLYELYQVVITKWLAQQFATREVLSSNPSNEV